MLKNKRTQISGKSLPLNILLIAINLVGLLLLVMGYHPSYEDSGLTLKIIGYSTLILTLIGVLIFEGWVLFSYVARVLVGGLFIVSGLIKANDPKGFAYKLEEYFEDGALAYRIKDWFGWESFSLEYLIEYALVISIAICIFEIVLGALVLLGSKIRTASWLMLAMMLFFTFLTWHTKECDSSATFKDVDQYELTSARAQAKLAQADHDENITILKKTDSYVQVKEVKKPQCVDDCGCFGDAMKGSIGRSLTPSESFWKDIVLLYLVLMIFISRRKIKPNNLRENFVLLFFGLVFIGLFSYIFTWTFPVFFGLISLLLALWIKRTGGKVLGNDLGVILMLTLTSVIFVTYVLMYLPLRDYRQYHVGSDLVEKMKDGQPGVFENVIVYTNKKTNIDTALVKLDSSTVEIWGNENWKFTKRNTKEIVPQILPSIQQFDPVISIENLTNTERSFDYIEDILDSNRVEYINIIDKESGDRYPQLATEFNAPDWDTSQYVLGDTILRLNESLGEISLKDYILEQDQIIIVFSRFLDKGNFSRIARLKEIAKNAKENDIPMLVISTATKPEVTAFRERTGLNIPTLQNDETELKTITRANPTLMVIKNGVVKGKYSYRSTPSWGWLTTNMLNIEK